MPVGTKQFRWLLIAGPGIIDVVLNDLDALCQSENARFSTTGVLSESHHLQMLTGLSRRIVPGVLHLEPVQQFSINEIIEVHRMVESGHRQGLLFVDGVTFR